jgi:hypothetical protein
MFYAVLLHILASLISTPKAETDDKEVVRMTASEWVVRGVTASVLVAADFAVNAAVTAGSG